MRSRPTARQQRLGAELRKLRESSGLTATEAGALLGADQSRISNIESGRTGISATRLRTLVSHYDCSDHGLIDALAGMTGSRKRGWWEEYRGILPDTMLDITELEHHAVALRTAQTSSLPGLLQTADHARVVFSQVVPPLPAHMVEHQVSHRIKRSEVLFGDSPVAYTAVIHEAAVRMRFGGRATTRAQLDHILTASERENITVVVIPFEAGEYPGSGQTILYAVGPVPQLDTVQLDQAHGPLFQDDADELTRYREILHRLESMALKPADSRDLIHNIARTL